MQFARRIWIAAACTLAVLMGASAAQAQPTKLLPSDTEMFMTFNIRQILASEVAKGNQAIIELAKGKIEEQLDDKGVAQWLKKADFDLFKDLHSVTFAVPGGRNPEEAFILLEGKFDAQKIEAAVKEASKEAGGGVKVIKIAGVKAFEVSPGNEKTMYVGVLDKKTMIACATKKDFEEAVARQNGTKTGSFKAEVIKNLAATVNNKQSISIVATSSILAKLAEKAPEGAGADQIKTAMMILKTMDGFSAAVTINKDIDLQIGVNTKDAETAQKYAGVSNLTIGVAKMKVAELAKQNEKLAPAVEIMNSVRVNAQGSNLLIRAQITFENLQKLLENLPPMN